MRSAGRSRGTSRHPLTSLPSQPPTIKSTSTPTVTPTVSSTTTTTVTPTLTSRHRQIPPTATPFNPTPALTIPGTSAAG